MIDDKTAKQNLIEVLSNKRAVLLAGAGNSNSVGYPMWGELIEQLRIKFCPQSNWTSQTPMEFASLILNEIKRTKRLDDYYNFLERTFQPLNNRKLHDDFHVALVQLGFCGLVTTNYEEVIESACREAFTSPFGGPFQCQPIDLCSNRHYRVFDFLRSLALRTNPQWVLHLHGHYTNPRDIILTLEDYLTKYGEQPVFDSDGIVQNRFLDSLHRKVLWTLLTTHSLVFVGFSLRDDFFTHVLRIIQTDFRLGSDFAHFAFMSYTTDEDKDVTFQFLKDHNTMPIFYHAPIDSTGKPNHRNLRRLILDLAQEVGAPSISSEPAIIELNRKMLEL